MLAVRCSAQTPLTAATLLVISEGFWTLGALGSGSQCFLPVFILRKYLLMLCLECTSDIINMCSSQVLLIAHDVLLYVRLSVLINFIIVKLYV